MTDGATAGNAIQKALIQDWKEAIRINSEILKSDKKNIDALNRLGFAYLQTGNLAHAKKCFNQVLSIDQYNQIAEKNLKKLTVTRKRNHVVDAPHSLLSPLIFLEEPGKTKIINCINVAPSKILASIMSGQEVYLKPKKYCIEIRDNDDTYLAALPDDISFKLIKYIAGGNIYQANVKSIGKNSLTVFLRELSRSKKFASQPSFTQSGGFIPLARSELVAVEKPDVSATGEEDIEEEEKI